MLAERRSSYEGKTVSLLFFLGTVQRKDDQPVFKIDDLGAAVIESIPVVQLLFYFRLC